MTYLSYHLLRASIILCIITLSIVGAGPSLFAADTESPHVASSWTTHAITVDGDAGDWEGSTFYIDELKGVINVCNDDTYLYLCLLSANRDVMRQIMMSGMTIWLNNTNEKARTCGLRFTLRKGMRPERGEDLPPTAEHGLGRIPAPSGEGMQEADIQRLFAARMEHMNSFEIVKPGEDTLTVQMADSAGIRVRTGFARGAFTYEFRIPIGRDTKERCCINADPGELIAIGFDSPRIDRGKMMNARQRPAMDGGTDGMGGGRDGRGGGLRPGMGGGRGGRGGLRPGMGGGRGGRSGGMERRPGGDYQAPEPFEAWITVHLATR